MSDSKIEFGDELLKWQLISMVIIVIGLSITLFMHGYILGIDTNNFAFIALCISAIILVIASLRQKKT